MGQQQLLLLVLGVIIVGVAIVAGIGMFNASAEESTKDEITSQVMAIAANAQQWYKKPVAMGGDMAGTFYRLCISRKIQCNTKLWYYYCNRYNYSLYCGILCKLVQIKH